jgi:hypothetical protein
MTLPHVDLGNSFQDVGQGANTFAAGLMAQRQRQQQLALQEALAKSQSAHLDAETNTQIPAQAAEADARTTYLGSQTQDAAAQAAQREAANMPADDDDESRLREVDPSAPHGIYRGYTKAMANEHTKTIAGYMAAKQRIAGINDRFYDRGQLAYDPTGAGVLIHPNQPAGGTPQPVGGGVGKPLSPNERVFAGAGQAAQSAHHDLTQFEQTHPEALNEIAKAISLPNFGHVVPGMGANISRVLQSFRLQGASPEAQAYLKRMFDFAGVVGPKRYGLRGMQNEVTLQQLWTDFGAGQFGLTREGIAAAQKNRANAVNQLEESAGPRAWDQSQNVFPQGQDAPVTTPVNKYGYKR